jgi:hypothetical protein
MSLTLFGSIVMPVGCVFAGSMAQLPSNEPESVYLKTLSDVPSTTQSDVPSVVAAEEDLAVVVTTGTGREAAHQHPALYRHRSRELQAVGIRNLRSVVHPVEAERLPDLAGRIRRAAVQRGVVQPHRVGRGAVRGPPADQAAGRGDRRWHGSIFQVFEMEPCPSAELAGSHPYGGVTAAASLGADGPG